MCGSPALAIKRVMDGICQTPREYWMHSNAASSLAALERCYTLFLFLLTSHRIGRTGRAGAKGTAITFFTTDSKLSTYR